MVTHPVQICIQYPSFLVPEELHVFISLLLCLSCKYLCTGSRSRVSVFPVPRTVGSSRWMNVCYIKEPGLGVPGWLSELSDSWFQLRSWSQPGLWDRAPCQSLHWACTLLKIFSLPQPLSSARMHVRSLSTPHSLFQLKKKKKRPVIAIYIERLKLSHWNLIRIHIKPCSWSTPQKWNKHKIVALFLACMKKRCLDKKKNKQAHLDMV